MIELKNETTEKILTRYSRKDIIKGTALVGLLSAMGVTTRPHGAGAASVLRIEVGMTPQEINQVIEQANTFRSPVVVAYGSHQMGTTPLSPFTGIPIITGEFLGTGLVFGNCGGRAASVVSGGQEGTSVRIENLNFVGPGSTTVVKGVESTPQDGFSVGGASGQGRAHARFRNCIFERWNHGVVLENMTGHAFFYDCGFARSTFNVWLRLSNGNYEFTRCSSTNAAKASYRLSKGEQFEHTIWQGGHHTHVPYVFYRTADIQQRGGIGFHALRCSFIHEQFEWIGNGLCFSEPGGSGFQSVRFQGAGQSFDDSALWPGKPRDYMIDTGSLQGVIAENCEQWRPGSKGLIRVASTSSIQWAGRKPAGAVVGPFSKVLDHSL